MSLTESTPFTYPTLIEAVTRQQYPAGTFYVVATPIGNIADISLRALHLLSLADAIACEDTRNTAQLLSRYGIQKPLIAAHQHNEREVAGKSCNACKLENASHWYRMQVRPVFLTRVPKSSMNSKRPGFRSPRCPALRPRYQPYPPAVCWMSIFTSPVFYPVKRDSAPPSCNSWRACRPA